jgi:hypothetical protein
MTFRTMGMALWTGIFYHKPALLSPFYQLYRACEPPIHHSVCDELKARMLYLPTEEELRKELAPGHERREVAPNARSARIKSQTPPISLRFAGHSVYLQSI